MEGQAGSWAGLGQGLMTDVVCTALSVITFVLYIDNTTAIGGRLLSTLPPAGPLARVPAHVSPPPSPAPTS